MPTHQAWRFWESADSATSGTARDTEETMHFAVLSGVPARIEELLAQAADGYILFRSSSSSYRRRSARHTTSCRSVRVGHSRQMLLLIGSDWPIGLAIGLLPRA